MGIFEDIRYIEKSMNTQEFLLVTSIHLVLPLKQICLMNLAESIGLDWQGKIVILVIYSWLLECKTSCHRVSDRVDRAGFFQPCT